MKLFKIALLVFLFASIRANAQVYFTMSDSTGCAPLTVQFTNQSSTGAVYYYWSVSDGTTSSDTNFSYTFTQGGTYYTIWLYAYDANYNYLGNYTKSIVTDGNSPYFYVSNFQACPNEPVSFSYYTPSGSVQWNFSDGFTANNSYVSHYFSDTGSYQVACIVDGVCGIDTFYNSISVENNLVSTISFGFNGASLCPGAPIYFYPYSQAQSYSWDFGDGNTSVQSNPTNSFSSASDYAVTLNAVNYCGISSSSSQTVSISSSSSINPFISSYASNSMPCPGQLIDVYTDGGYSGYKFDFGDGTPVLNSQYEYVQHAFADTGIYNIAITVMNACGNDTTIYREVNVNINGRVLDGYISTNASSSCPGQNVGFYATYGYSNYEWDFGNGNIFSDNSSTRYFTFQDTGTYPISCKITNQCGNDTTVYYTHVVSNNSPITGSVFMSVLPNVICPNTNARFSATSTFKTYEWNFGDSSSLVTGPPFSLYHYYEQEGSYTVTLKLTNYCGADTIITKNILVTANNHLPANTAIYGTEEACPNDVASFNVSGGSGIYFSNYTSSVWDFGDGTARDSNTYISSSHRYTSLGNYVVSAHLYNNCGNDTIVYFNCKISSKPIVRFNDPDFIISTYSGETSLCNNDEVTFYAPGGYAKYFWDFGDNNLIEGTETMKHTFTQQGSVDVSVKIVNGCDYDTTLFLHIIVGNNIAAGGMFISGSSVVCPGEQIKFFAQEGFVKYFWNFGDGDTITTYYYYYQKAYDTAGIYTVTVTGYNGCGYSSTSSRVFSVSEESQMRFLTVSTSTGSVCTNDDVLFSISGGLSSYIYKWNFGDGDTATTIGQGISHAYDSLGVYNMSVEVTNACGISKTYNSSVTVNNGSVPVLNPGSFGFFSASSSALAGCPGDAVAFFFYGSYDHLWNFGDGTSGSATESFLLSNGTPCTIIRHSFSATGTYYAKLTRYNSCGQSITDSVQVDIGSSSMVQGFVTASAPLTIGGFNTCAPIGFLSGGGNSYTWNYGDGVQEITSTPTTSHLYSNAGVYTLNVEVKNGCGLSDNFYYSVSVNPGPAIQTSFSGVVNPTCSQSNGGAVTVTVNGGSAPYSYIWNNNASLTQPALSNLSAGQYIVKIQDAGNCQITDTIQLTSTSTLGLNLTFSSTTSCGSNTGGALVQVTGGISPFTYTWSNGASGQMVSNLGVGIYTATVTDGAGCNFNLPVTISSDQGATIAAQTIQNVACYGNNDGVIDITVQGGTSPYTYQWSNGLTGEDISSLVAGSYSCVVTDANGCQSIANFSVGEPAALAGVLTINNADCSKFNGDAVISVSGGATPYTYLWSEGSTSDMQSGLPVGDYSVLVTDNNGCTKNVNFKIGNNNAPVVTATVNNVVCAAQQNGSITLQITGGTSPYLKTWTNNGSHSNSLTNLATGTYTVSVLDASGCQVYQSFSISEPTELQVNVVSQNTICNKAVGMVSAMVTGGTPPYVYSWAPLNSNDSAVYQLPDGNYDLTVTDNNGCSIAANAIINTEATPVDICIVTVNENNKNVVVWTKSIGQSIQYFNIYKETIVANQYALIETLPFDSLSEFEDLLSDARVRSNRYKISTIDSCSNESVLSTVHKTLHMTVGPAIQPGQSNLTIEGYEGINYGTFNLYHGTDLNSMVKFDSIPSNLFTYTDINPPSASNDSVYYFVGFDLDQPCFSTRGRNYNAVKSNTANLRTSSLVGNANLDLSSLVKVYPNPSTGILFINSAEDVTISIVDILGSKIAESKIPAGKNAVDIKDLASGSYFVVVKGEHSNKTEHWILAR